MYNIQEEEKVKEEEKSEMHYINDSALLEQELGYWEMQEAEQQFLKEEMDRRNKEKLSRSELKSLDRR